MREGGRERERERERTCVSELWEEGWLLPFKLLKRKSEGKISAEAEKQTSHWEAHLVHHFWESRKDLAMPAEVKEVGAWWNGSISSVPSLFFAFQF